MIEERLGAFYAFLGQEVCAAVGPQITPAQALIILRMPEHGSCPQSQLSHFGSNKSHNTKVLVAKGYVIKTKSRTDHRTFQIALTDLGHQLRRRFEKACENRVHLIAVG